MKVYFTLFVAVLLFAANTSFSQNHKSVLERVSLAKAGDGALCVELAWKKGSENTSYYLVERSVDGKEFKQVGLVFTSEDPQFSDYKFRDKNYTISGNAPYYRIVLVNEQKEMAYLPARQLQP